MNQYGKYFKERERAVCEEVIDQVVLRFKVLKEKTVSTEYQKKWIERQF